MSFRKTGDIHKLMNMLESYVSLLNNEEEIGIGLPKQNLISICPNILDDNGNIFHRIFEVNNEEGIEIGLPKQNLISI